MRPRVLIVILVAVLALVAVYQRRTGCSREQAPGPALSARSLRNAEYRSEFIDSGRVQLRNGKLEDPAAHLWVTMLNVVAYGDVDGDGRSDAAVILATNTGGSGVFHDLAVVVDRDGRPFNTASVNLGDRVKINSLAIEEGRIVVDMVTQGPSDPMCCPTMHVTQRYELLGDSLVLTEQVPQGTDRTE